MNELENICLRIETCMKHYNGNFEAEDVRNYISRNCQIVSTHLKVDVIPDEEEIWVDVIYVPQDSLLCFEFDPKTLKLRG